jgi:hypothetical protein
MTSQTFSWRSESASTTSASPETTKYVCMYISDNSNSNKEIFMCIKYFLSYVCKYVCIYVCINLFLYLLFVLGQGVFSMVVDSIFATFAISFLVTRLIIFPRYLLSSLLFEAPRILGMWPGYWVFAGLLVCSYTYVRMYVCMFISMFICMLLSMYVCKLSRLFSIQVRLCYNFSRTILK